MDCQDFVELVTEYLDDALDAATRARFEAHLADCPYCDRYLVQLRVTAHTLGQVSLAPLDTSAREALLSAFRDWSTARS